MTPSNHSEARIQALLTRDEFVPVPTSLISYQSSGHVIMIGDSADLALAQSMSLNLPISPILMSGVADESMPANTIYLAGRRLEIDGYLGSFRVTLNDGSGSTEVVSADLVVDLNKQAIINLEILPPGYLHRNIQQMGVEALSQELSEMTGTFEKPKYFHYDASICAHGVNGVQFCTQCIDACPADAIISLGEKIEVNPFLCQGGGVCATACPSGAIRYVYPSLADSGNQIRKMLNSYREQGGHQAIVVFYSGDEVEAAEQSILSSHSEMLPVRVEELASVGMDLCLSALVYGASQVILLVNPNAPKSALEVLERQLGWVKAMLVGLEINADRISLIDDLTDRITDNINSLSMTELSIGSWQIEPAIYTMPDKKRNAIYQAIDHLYQQSTKQQEQIELPAGAPFGTATIDSKSCTLCLACVGACPGKALQDGSNREVPEVFFIESNCIQCNVCTLTCPEQAIEITPRIIFDREKRNRSRALNQDTPFACIGCGKAFAPTSVIAKMTEKLKDHYMFRGPRALDRLKMCEDCRVVDIVQDDAAMSGRFDTLN
ncbi:MAG: ferredoxin [Polaribacter sp.]|jgi:ferredoxin